MRAWRPGHRPRRRVGRLDAFPDQPQSAPFGGKRLPVSAIRRAGLADEPGQMPATARIGDQAERRKALDELGRFGRDDEIAGQRDIGAGAGSDSVDSGDHWLRQSGERADQRVPARLDRIAEIDRLARRHRAVVKPDSEKTAAGAVRMTTRASRERRARRRSYA